MQESPIALVVRSGFAVLANAAAVVTSMQEQIEWHFRMASLTVGILVGAATIYTLLRPKRK